MIIKCWFYVSPLGTFKDVVFTQDSIKAWSALAHKAVDIVLADGTIPAGLAGALVYLSLTALPFKSRAAFAGEAPNIVHTGASIQAWVYRGRRERGKKQQSPLIMSNPPAVWLKLKKSKKNTDSVEAPSFFFFYQVCMYEIFFTLIPMCDSIPQVSMLLLLEYLQIH